MLQYHQMPKEELLACREELLQRVESFKKSGQKFLLTRGKPCKEQLDLSMGMLNELHADSNLLSLTGDDYRNYGDPDGLPEMRSLFGDLIGAPAENIIIGNNSSLNMMFDVISCGVTHGFGGCKPWGKTGESKVFVSRTGL